MLVKYPRSPEKLFPVVEKEFIKLDLEWMSAGRQYLRSHGYDFVNWIHHFLESEVDSHFRDFFLI